LETGLTLATNGNTGIGQRHNRRNNDRSNKKDELKKEHISTDNTKNDVDSYLPSTKIHLETTNTLMGTTNRFTLNISSNAIPSHCILIDNQSTIDVFCEPSLLSNTWDAEAIMEIKFNAGKVSTTVLVILVIMVQYGTVKVVLQTYCHLQMHATKSTLLSIILPKMNLS
jgi:hypothetical protein